MGRNEFVKRLMGVKGFDLFRESTNITWERPDLGPERPNLDSEKPDIVSERPTMTTEGPDPVPS